MLGRKNGGHETHPSIASIARFRCSGSVPHASMIRAKSASSAAPSAAHNSETVVSAGDFAEDGCLQIRHRGFDTGPRRLRRRPLDVGRVTADQGEHGPADGFGERRPRGHDWAKSAFGNTYLNCDRLAERYQSNKQFFALGSGKRREGSFDRVTINRLSHFCLTPRILRGIRGVLLTLNQRVDGSSPSGGISQVPRPQAFVLASF